MSLAELLHPTDPAAVLAYFQDRADETAREARMMYRERHLQGTAVVWQRSSSMLYAGARLMVPRLSSLPAKDPD